HPGVTASKPGRCPKCWMKLVVSDVPATPAPKPHDGPPHGGHEAGDGLEWEDLMPAINRASDPSNMIWKLVDRETGAENGAIAWAFRVGDRVKIRLVNEMESDHPMHHPFHIHGAGRFLILRPLPDPVEGWRPGVQSRVEGHRAAARGTDRRHPAGCHESRAMDGALPHRGTHRERDDVQLRCFAARVDRRGSFPNEGLASSSWGPVRPIGPVDDGVTFPAS